MDNREQVQFLLEHAPSWRVVVATWIALVIFAVGATGVRSLFGQPAVRKVATLNLSPAPLRHPGSMYLNGGSSIVKRQSQNF
jgi:hypothetical protein